MQIYCELDSLCQELLQFKSPVVEKHVGRAEPSDVTTLLSLAVINIKYGAYVVEQATGVASPSMTADQRRAFSSPIIRDNLWKSVAEDSEHEDQRLSPKY